MKTPVKIALAVLGVLLVLFLAALAYWLAVTSSAALLPEKLTLAEGGVRVYDASGEPLEACVPSRTGADELPDALKDAFVAVEDKRFYRHHGVDFLRIGKAAVKNLLSFSFKEGASTISQQLIKNTHLSGEKTLNRKLKELKLARELEKRYSKEEILELYLNSIYFGHSAFGVGAAARFYFGKETAALTPAECAMLAALVRSPNRYSPFKDAEACKKRRDFVLSLMAEQGYLSPDGARAAAEEPLPAEPAEAPPGSAYLALVFEELDALLPGEERAGLRVFTDYEPALQELLEAQSADSDRAALVIHVPTGGVRAFFSTCGQIRRLPASTVKPLLVYAPALEEGIASPATPILDEKTDFGGYSPSDYGGESNRYMSVRYALSRSVNVPAVKLLHTLGVDRAAAYLERMGLAVPEEDRSLALALGGMKEGFTLKELADAYATFPRLGLFTPSFAVRRIESAEGKTLFSRECQGKILDSKCQGKILDRRVFSEDTASLMSDMLKTAAREGTAKKLRTLPFEVCAKTGTGGTDGGNTDAYTVAYTTEDVVAVWLGNRDNTPVAAMGGGVPADFAKEILETLYRGGAPAPFSLSDGVVEALLDREEYEDNHRLLLADPLSPDFLALKELFRKTSLPAGTSTKFSRPVIEMPSIAVQNGSVKIVLCQTQYYDYTVKRRCGEEIRVIYSGKYRRELFDNSVAPGKTYTYTVIPSYCGVEGEAVELPSVCVEDPRQLPEHWWE